MNERLRCNHPSGTKANDRCRLPAVASVRFWTGKKWSRWILACRKHAKSRHWYRDRIRKGAISEYVDDIGEVVIGYDYGFGPWKKVERGTIDDWRPQKRRGQR